MLKNKLLMEGFGSLLVSRLVISSCPWLISLGYNHVMATLIPVLDYPNVATSQGG